MFSSLLVMNSFQWDCVRKKHCVDRLLHIWWIMSNALTKWIRHCMYKVKKGSSGSQYCMKTGIKYSYHVDARVRTLSFKYQKILHVDFLSSFKQNIKDYHSCSLGHRCLSVYSSPTLSGHSQKRPPSLIRQQIFAVTTINASTSPSQQRPSI